MEGRSCVLAENRVGGPAAGFAVPLGRVRSEAQSKRLLYLLGAFPALPGTHTAARAGAMAARVKPSRSGDVYCWR